MNNLNCERKLEELVEQVSREISEDDLERIIKAHHNYNQVEGLVQNPELDVCGTRCESGTKNISTMTDHLSNPVSGMTVPDNNVTKPAEKRGTKKHNAEERKELQMANKMYKPGECMKHMTVEMHPALASAWYAADVAREVTATSARVRMSSALCDPALVLWSRGVASALATDSGLVQLAPAKEQCDRALYVMTAEELAELVAEKALSRQMGHIAQLTGCNTTLVVFGLQDYFKPTGRKKASSNHHQQMTEVELEMALTDLLVSACCDTVKVETPNELALTIVHFTKAIAESPYKKAKRQCEEQVQFYMRGDNKNCVVVNKNGVGTSKLWQQMLAILPMSSLERSRALCAQYPSPKRLYEELQSSGGVDRVADIGVTRSAVPGSLARRTGIEFARKLAILFTADDGDALVQ